MVTSYLFPLLLLAILLASDPVIPVRTEKPCLVSRVFLCGPRFALIHKIIWIATILSCQSFHPVNPGQTTETFLAAGPLGPCVTSN